MKSAALEAQLAKRLHGLAARMRVASETLRDQGITTAIEWAEGLPRFGAGEHARADGRLILELLTAELPDDDGEIRAAIHRATLELEADAGEQPEQLCAGCGVYAAARRDQTDGRLYCGLCVETIIERGTHSRLAFRPIR